MAANIMASAVPKAEAALFVMPQKHAGTAGVKGLYPMREPRNAIRFLEFP
jgi:hypothetical protein